MGQLEFEKFSTMTLEEIEKNASTCLTIELKELIQELESVINDKDINEEKRNKFSIILKTITEILDKKEKEQIRRFGKILPKDLELFLNDNFPNIENIFQKSADEITPFFLAMTNNDLNVIKLLFTIKPISEFVAKDEKAFAEYMCLPQVSEQLYQYIIDKVMQEGDAKSLEIGIQQSLSLATFLSFLEGKPEEKLLKKKFKILEHYKGQINWLDDSNNKLEELLFYIFTSDAGIPEYWISFIKKEDFIANNENNIKNIQILVKNLIERFSFALLNLRLDSDKDKEKARKNIPIFENWIDKIFAFIPVNLYPKIKEILQPMSADLWHNALASSNIKLITLLLDYGLSDNLNFKDILTNNDKDIIQLFIKYKGTNFFLDKLLIEINAYDSGYYYFGGNEAYQKLASLPITLNPEQYEKLIKAVLGQKYDHRISDSTIDLIKNRFGGELTTDIKELFEKKVNLEITMDDRLFGHINNDFALKGTILEGSLLSNTANFLKKFANNIIQDKIQIKGITKQKEIAYKTSMTKIGEKLNDFLVIDSLIQQAASNKVIRETVGLEPSSNFIADKMIALLKQKGNIIIPGGWIGLNNTTGHAMLYEIKKTDNGYRLLIHNTGAGINYHTQKEMNNAIYFSSVKAFELPLSSIEGNEELFKNLFKQLIRPQIVPGFGQEYYTADKLYSELMTVTQKLGFKEVSPDLDNKVWTKGQHSGTCTWKAFSSYLRTFPYEEGINYSELNYEIKKTSLEEYYANVLKDNRLADAQVQRQINFALQNLARHIRRLAEKEPPLSHERVLEGFSLIQKVSDGLSKFVKKGKSRLGMKKRTLAQYITDTALIDSSKKSLVSKKIKESDDDNIMTFEHNVFTVKTEAHTMEFEKVKSNVVPNLSIISKDSDSPLKSIKEVFEQCQSNFKEGYYSSVTMAIENLYLSLTIDNKLWENIPKPNLLEYLNMIQKLNTLYIVSNAKQQLTPFASQSVVLFSGEAIAQNIVLEYFNNNELIKKGILTQVSQFADSRLKEITDSPYFVTNNSLHNKRIIDLKNKHQVLYNYRKDFDDSSTYLMNVICRDLTLKKKILQYFESDNNFKKIAEDNPNIPIEMQITEYYIKNFQAMKAYFPEINEALEVCMHFEKVTTELNEFSEGKLDAMVGLDPNQDPMQLFKAHQWTSLYKEATGNYSYTVYPWLKKNYNSNQIYTLDSSIPKIANKVYLDSLESRLNSNQIQTETQKGAVVSEEVAFQRALMNSRSDPDSQVSASVDLLKKYFHKLEEPEFQNFLFLNIFHSDFLEKQLQETPNIISDMLNEINRGLKIYIQNKKIKQPGIFLLKFATHLNQLLVTLKDNNKNWIFKNEISELTLISNQLSQEIEFYTERTKKYSNEHENNILYQLQSLNLCRLSSLLEFNSKLNAEEVNQLMEAISYKKNSPTTAELDPFLEYQSEQAKAKCVKMMQDHIENLSKHKREDFETLLNTILKNRGLMLPIEKFKWSGAFPLYSLVLENNSEVFAINIATGQLFKNKMQVLPLPSFVYNNPLYTKFFHEKNVLATANANQTIFEFTINNIKYRFSSQAADNLNHPLGVLFREIEINGQKKWYEYHEKMSFTELPRRFFEQGSTNWVSIEPNRDGFQETIIINEKDQSIICYYDTRGVVHEIGKNNEATGFKLFNTTTSKLTEHGFGLLVQSKSAALLNRFTALTKTEFEAHVNYEFWGKELPNGQMEYLIRLPRYGLEFSQKTNPDGSLGDIIWLKDPRYKVKLPELDIIPNFKSAIQLTPIEGQLAEELVLVPKQQFIADALPESEYYTLLFDTNGEVIKKTLVYNKLYRPDEIENHLHLQKFKNSESYAVFKSNSAGELQPETIEDKFYLAYLYLAKRQPLLAFETLRDALKVPFTLNAEQLEHLRRIMLEIPFRAHGPPPETKVEDDARLSSPEVLAVRALAASVLAEQKMKFKGEIFLDEIEESRHRLTNRDYHKFTREKTLKFWSDKNLAGILIEAFENYNKLQAKVPPGMRLEMQEERNILRFASKHVPLKTHLKYRKNKIHLYYLNLERKRLEKLKGSNKLKFPLVLQQRLEMITKKIENYPSIKQTHQEIQKVSVTLRPDSLLSQFPSEIALLKGDNSIIFATKIPTSKLNYSVEDSDFIFSFNDYYTLARNPLSNAKEKEEIKNGLEIALSTAAIKITTGSKLSLRENLSIILFYVLEKPESFIEGPINFENIQTVVDQIQQLVTTKKGLSKDVNVLANREGQLKIASIKHKDEVPLSINTKIVGPIKPILAPEIKRFSEIFEQQKRKFKGLLPSLDNIQPKENMEKIKQTLYQEIQKDYGVGANKNLETIQRNHASNLFYQSLEDNGKSILEKLSEGILENNKVVEALKTAIVELANKPPKDPKLFVEWSLQKEAGLRADLNFEQILHLFLMQDKTLFQNATVLDDTDISRLNSHIHAFLLNATMLQHYQRIESEFNKLTDSKLSQEKRSAVINQIGNFLSMERCFDPTQNPELLLFEYLDNKLLFPEQYAYLKDLIKQDENGYISQAVQLIMGGGKSKVLLPLLALKKANGNNLSVIEVPDALFQFNKADLGATTQKLFNRKAHDFYFDDSVICSLDYLKNLRNELRSIILNREYLITTKESRESFELKSIKFLKLMNENDPESLEKAKLFTEINRIFTYQGDAIIDEIDSALDVRKQLIYTVGRGEAVPKHELEAVLDLHAFFEHVQVRLGQEDISLQDIFLGKKSPSKQEWPNVFDALTRALLNDKNSPLSSILEKIMKDEDSDIRRFKKDILYLYLLGEHQAIPDFINILSPEEKDKIAIYKEELINILPLTLKKNLEEHFGLSKDKSKALEGELAIPFLASNTPNERSKFGNYLETINYTLRIQLSKNLSLETIKAMVQSFKTQEEEALKYYYGRQKPADYESPSDKFFKLTGVHLDEVDTENLSGMVNVHSSPGIIPATRHQQSFTEAIINNMKVKRYCLIHFILNNIEKNTEILSSDAQNHTRQYRSIQGMTGTDWNYRTYPSFIKPNKAVSLGSDGQTRHHLLRHPQPVHVISEMAGSTKERMGSVLSLFENHPNKKSLHAWIDLGAYFKGITNRTVANNLSQYFASKPEFSHLEYILFFGPDDKLYAIKTDSNPNNLEAKLLERTDPEFIKATLGIGPEKYFTYYDQRRITGTDIKQDTDAHAFVPIGLKTLDRDLLQAVMRMRELKGEQRVEFVIPKEVQEAYPEIKDWNVSAIMKLCIDTQVERLSEDHFRSALQTMRSLIRKDLWDRVLSHYDDPKLQKQLMNKFDKAFFTIMNKTAFEQYGQIKEKEKTELVLNEVADNTIKQWETLLSSAKIQIAEDELMKFKQEITEVVNNSVKICSEEVYKVRSESESALSDANVEIEKEEETEKAEELERELDYHFQGSAVPVAPSHLSKIDFNLFTLAEGKSKGGLIIETLESMNLRKKLETPTISKASSVEETDKSRIDKRQWQFGPNIYVSSNFAHTYEDQSSGIDAYKKDATFFLVEQDDKTKEVKFLLITSAEATNLAKSLKTLEPNKGKHFWIETTHQTIRAGIKPTQLSENYQLGLEQIALFNNDTDVMFNMFSEKSWLRDKPEEKLQYLERVIRPIHKDKVDLIAPLRYKIHQTIKLPSKTMLTGFKTQDRPATKVQDRDIESGPNFNV